MVPLSFWNRLFPQKFDWLQIAVTSHCNASCFYCPHSVYRQNWVSRHLSLVTFQRLLPDLKKINLLYLQGWGEPFLNPDFFTFVSLAKQAGCRVGATTNARRQGTSFWQVLEAIHSLQECKRRLGKITPRVHIAYMLLRSGLSDLERLPIALQGLNVSQVVISTLDLVAAPELEKESLAAISPAENTELNRCLGEVTAAGARRGLPIHYAGKSFLSPQPMCPENVLRAAVVSTEGEVAACVYTNVPTAAGDYYVKGKPHPVKSVFFGNVYECSLQEIWRQSAYRDFRRTWQRQNLIGPCRSCLKIHAS